jgi:hypothetical protein
MMMTESLLSCAPAKTSKAILKAEVKSSFFMVMEFACKAIAKGLKKMLTSILSQHFYMSGNSPYLCGKFLP